MRRNLTAIVLLVLLLTLLDQLYRVLHPEVNLVRASLVGATAYGALLLLRRAGFPPAPAGRGALAIFASAFGSVLMIEAGWLVSRSLASAAVHVALLAAAFLASGLRLRRPSGGAARPRGARASTDASLPHARLIESGAVHPCGRGAA